MPFTKKRDKSPSSTPVPSTENAGAQLPDQQWDAMTKVLNAIYDYRTEDGFDPSKLFHRMVNKRAIPEYYDTIKEPIALSTIKHKIHQRAYQSFVEFVRDFALIPYNAQVFNRPDSGAFQDALVIKEQLERNLQQLVDSGIVTKDAVTLPDLGPIPTYEDAPGEDGEDDESEEEEGEEDEEDEDEEGGQSQRRKRGRPRLQKRETGDDEGVTRKRGRPPRLLTPIEARIQSVLKALRKVKNERGQLMVRHFERLPDKQSMPEYYAEIKNPMAYDLLKRKVKRKKYATLEAFMADVNLMLNNAKSYNTEESQIYRDAHELQIMAGRHYDAMKSMSDRVFADDDGKLPMPDGILHNGELYKVGDWVHVQNTNDLTKPIPGQVYRTYKNQAGQAMVNVCWYYRPEQTVHRFDKHFFDHEVVKTGRYRDHQIDEIEGRCFIMFVTRFFKGRPRGLPQGSEIYVCEARYNEDKHQFNKIKTWASCLPDEVRDRDYEMDLYEQPKRVKKYPSPIKYLLRDDQKETDDLPKVTWGAEGAPPKIGAVHRRPRADRDSLPPEPTPPPPPPRMRSPTRTAESSSTQINIQPQQSQHQASAIQRPVQTQFKNSYGASPSSRYNQSNTPGIQRASIVQSAYSPLNAQHSVRPSSNQAHSSSGLASVTGANVSQISGYSSRPGLPQTSTASYRDPPTIEVYTLPDQANLSIPLEVREHYQQDDQGRVLFFTAPPLVPSEKADNKASTLRGHSVKYLAEKARRAGSIALKRKTREVEIEKATATKKQARIERAEQFANNIDLLKLRALEVLAEQLQSAADNELSSEDMTRLKIVQADALRKKQALLEHDEQRAASRTVKLDDGIYQDEWDNRLTA